MTPRSKSKSEYVDKKFQETEKKRQLLLEKLRKKRSEIKEKNLDNSIEHFSVTLFRIPKRK